MEKTKNINGWLITFAALGVNLILGLLYGWSVFKKALVGEWGWSNTAAALPYTVAAAVFAVTMIFAGRAQDKIGPKYVVMIGGIIFGFGLIGSGFVNTPLMMTITFGLIGGIGIGFGYSATTPCAIKWFDPSKKGLISGIVVSGVGLAPVFIAPLTAYLIGSVGIQQTFIVLGIIAITAITLFSLFLKNPSETFVPKQNTISSKAVKSLVDMDWSSMVKTPKFYLLWFTYLLTATAGLMLIAHIASIAGDQAGWKAGFILVVFLSIFNAAGRVFGGMLLDKMGRNSAMLFVIALQAVNMFAFTFYSSIPLLIAGTCVAGLAYGALFSLFPATTADFFGMKNLGVNYGLVFTGWGVAGIVGPLLAGQVRDITGTYSISYIIAGILLIIGIILVVSTKNPVVSEADKK